MSELYSTLQRTAKTFNLLSAPPKVDVGTAPTEVVFEDGKMKLLRYKPMVDEPCKVPVLIIYALVNKPYILDLQPDKSVIRTLLRGGFDVYMIDWGIPTEGDKYLTLDDYINGYTLDCVDFIRENHGLDSISIFGYCMGGTLSLMFACLYPERVKNLILMAAPLDFEADDSILSVWAAKEHFHVDNIVDTTGNVPGYFLNFAFLLLDPVNNLYSKYIKFIDRVDNEEFVKMFFRMERWINDGIPVAGETYREFIKKLYQENQLVKGEFHLNGRRVDLDRITMPLLSIIAERDHLVTKESSKSINDLVPAKDKERIIFPTGHIGLSVSSAAHSKLWPKVVGWLRERSHPTLEEKDKISLISVKGIGRKTAEKLEDMGIKSVEDLIHGDHKAISKAMKLPLKRVQTWVNDAQKLNKEQKEI